MFVHKKVNISGVVSAQVITKVNGKSKLVRTIGSSQIVKEIDDAVEKGYQFIATFGGQRTFDFSYESSLLRSVFQIRLSTIAVRNSNFALLNIVIGPPICVSKLTPGSTHLSYHFPGKLK